MKPSYQKLASELLNDKTHTPKGMKFQFINAQINENDFEKQIYFLDKNRVFFTSFPNSMDMSQIQRIFIWISDSIASLDSKDPKNDPIILNLLCHFETLLSVIKEERYWLMFEQYPKILEIMTNTTNIDVVLAIIRLLFLVLKSKIRVNQIVIHTFSEEELERFFLMLMVWNLGINLLNDHPQSFGEKLTLEDFKVYESLAIRKDDLYNNQLIFADICNNFRLEAISMAQMLHIDLREHKGESLDQLLSYLESQHSLKVAKNSLNYIFLKARLVLNEYLLDYETGTINSLGRQKLMLVTLSASSLWKLETKNPDLSEKFEKISIMFDPYLVNYNQKIGFEPLEKYLFCKYEQSNFFRTVMNFLHHNYVLVSEMPNEQNSKIKAFFQSVLEKVHQETFCKSQNREMVQVSPGPANLEFPLQPKTILELLRIINQLDLSENRQAGSSFSTDYAYIYELVVNIQSFYTQTLINTCDDEIIHILIEINRFFLQEIDRDKEFTFFDIFCTNLKSYISIFYKHKDSLQHFKGLYSNINTLIFETIEALESYFIEPLKSNNSFKVPKMARIMLDSDIWECPELVELVVNYPAFSMVFNELVVLLNDLLNNVSEIYIQAYIIKFSENGFIPLIIARIGVESVTNEFDSLGFLLNLFSKIILHNKELVGEDFIEGLLKWCFEQIFTRSAIIDNYKRFNGGDSNTALKNFADEVVTFCNVYSRFAPVVSKILISQMIEVKQMNQELSCFIMNSDSVIDFVTKINSADLLLKRFGWFTSVNGNPQTENDITDDFILYQKIGCNYIKFISRFFDNLNTNVYTTLNEEYKLIFKGKCIMSFIVGAFNEPMLYFDGPRKKRAISFFLRVLSMSHNQNFQRLVKEYVLTSIEPKCLRLKESITDLSPGELQEATTILFDKNYMTKRLFEFNFASITIKTRKIVKQYLSVVYLVEIMKILMIGNRNALSLAQIMKFYPVVLSTLSLVDQELVKNGEQLFKKILLEDLANHAFELYFDGIKAAEKFTFFNLFRIMRETSRPIGSEVLNDLILRAIVTKPKMESFRADFPILFLSRFITEIDRTTSQTAITYHSIVNLHFNLNKILEYVNMMVRFNENCDFATNQNELLFFLSKARFFSTTISNVVRFILIFVAKFKKEFKKIFQTKAEKAEIYINHAFYTYIIEERLAEACKFVTTLLDKVMKFQPFVFEVGEKPDDTANEVLISKTIEFDRLKTIAALASTMKSVNQDAFECFYLKEKSVEYFDGSIFKKKNKPSKQQIAIQSEPEQISRTFEMEDRVVEAAFNPSINENIPFKVCKNDLLNCFMTNYKNLLDSIFHNITRNIEISDESKTSMPKVISYHDLLEPTNKTKTSLFLVELALFRKIVPKSSIKYIREFNYANLEQEESYLPPQTNLFLNENPLELSNFKEEADKVKKEIDTSIDVLVIFYFNNWLHFSKARPILRVLWENYINFKHKDDKEAKLKLLRKMLAEAQTGLKLCIEGKTAKTRSKSEWKLIIKEKESILNILYLQFDLFNILQCLHPELFGGETLSQYFVEFNSCVGEERPLASHEEFQSNHVARPKKPETMANYLLLLIQKNLNPKYKKDKIQKLIVSCLKLLEKMILTLDDKLLVIDTIQAVLNFNASKPTNKEKEKVIVLDDKILKSILSIFCIMFENDEQILEKFASVYKFEIIKSLLRVRFEKSVSAQIKSEIKNNFQSMTEIILRQPHIFSLLIECEIKSCLFNQPDKCFELEKITTVLGKPFCGLEKMVALVISNVCEIYPNDKDANKRMIRLAKNQEFTTRNSDIRGFIAEFVSLLINDVLYKIQKQNQSADSNYIFNHIDVCELLFYQILPRYPIFYSSVLAKQKVLFLVYFVEKYLEVYHGYFQFIVPIFFDFSPLVKDQQGNIVSISVNIRSELMAKILSMVETKTVELIKYIKAQHSTEINGSEREHYVQIINECIYSLQNVFVFLFNAMKSENFNRELENKDLFSRITEILENFFTEVTNSGLINVNHFLTFLSVPDLLRRRQVIKLLNPNEFTQTVDKDVIQINVVQIPATYRFPPAGWMVSKNKMPIRAFSIAHTKEISYEMMIAKPAVNRYAFPSESHHNRQYRRNGRFYARLFEDDGPIHRFMDPHRIEFDRDVNSHRLAFDRDVDLDLGINEDDGDLEEEEDDAQDDDDNRHSLESPQSYNINSNRAANDLIQLNNIRNQMRETMRETQNHLNMHRREIHTEIHRTEQGMSTEGLQRSVSENVLNMITDTLNQIHETVEMINIPVPVGNFRQENAPNAHSESELDNSELASLSRIRSQTNRNPDGTSLRDHAYDNAINNIEDEDEQLGDIEEDDDENDQEEGSDDDDMSEDTDEERVSDEHNGEDSEDEHPDFEEGFEEELEEENESINSDEEENHVEFIDDDHYGDIDLIIDLQSQHSAHPEFESVYNYNHNNRSSSRVSSFSVLKLFSMYPYLTPLNLSNKGYVYYTDAIIEKYKDQLENHILPYSKPGNYSYYARIKKEFSKFASIFTSDKNKKQLGTGWFPAGGNTRAREIQIYDGLLNGRFNQNNVSIHLEAPRIFESTNALPIDNIPPFRNIIRRAEDDFMLNNRDQRRGFGTTNQSNQSASNNPLLAEILRTVLNEPDPATQPTNPNVNAPELTDVARPVNELSAQNRISVQTFARVNNVASDNQFALNSTSDLSENNRARYRSDNPNLNSQGNQIINLRQNRRTQNPTWNALENRLMDLMSVGQTQSPVSSRNNRAEQSSQVNPTNPTSSLSLERNPSENNASQPNNNQAIPNPDSGPQRPFLRRTVAEIVVNPQNEPFSNENSSQTRANQINNLQNPNITEHPAQNSIIQNESIQEPAIQRESPDLLKNTTSNNMPSNDQPISVPIQQEPEDIQNPASRNENDLQVLGQLPMEPLNNQNPQQNARPFNFELYGLPTNFLEIAGIDPTFFDALPLDFQVDTVISLATDIGLLQPGQSRPNIQSVRVNSNPVGPDRNQNRASEDSISVSHAQMQNAQDNNFTFIESLPADIRAEVLMTCPPEFLMTLPENIQEEAQRIRDTVNIDGIEPEEEESDNNNNPNVPSNRIKQSIKKNKQKDLIKKYLCGKSGDGKLYSSSNQFLDLILQLICEKCFQIDTFPISYLSSLLFDTENQNYFYSKLLELVENGAQVVKMRALVVLEILTYSNFSFFHEKRNFDRVLKLLNDSKSDEQLLLKLTRTVNHIVKTTLINIEAVEGCDVTINQENLDSLTCILYSKNQSLFDALSVILFMLSFNNKNLELIIDSLQENIAKLAFSLNLKFDEILKLDKHTIDKEVYLSTIAAKINEKLNLQNGIHKIFKLLEQLFKRSFSLNFNEDKNEGDALNEIESAKKRDEKSTRFNEIKNRILASFANYFKQANIKLLFLNMFKVLSIYEPILDTIKEKKRLSKPVFTKLLPLIESFFIIYKLLCDEEVLKSIKVNLQLKDAALPDIQIASFNEEIDQPDDESVRSITSANEKMSIENRDNMIFEEIANRRIFESHKSKSNEALSTITIESMFYKGVRTNKNIFNYFLNQIQKISSSPLSVIIRHTPRLVNFETKSKYFQQTVQGLRTTANLKLIIRRQNLFHDSYTQINNKSIPQLRGRLNIKFQDEEGVDAGGLQREWYNELSKEIFNPNYALFIPAVHGYAYQPSPFSTVNTEHLSYFKFIGKIFGRVLLDNNLIDAHFTRSFYKHMTGTPLNYLDLEDYDSEYFRTIKWILENDVEGLDLDFTYEREIFGVKQLLNLKPNGSSIKVTNENKAEYVRLICEQKLTEEIRPQIKSFLEGLNSLIPAHLIKIFDFKELELMFSGMPEINLQDLKDNTEYYNYTANSTIIQYFWEVLKDFDEGLKAGFLQFVTGTSKVPLEGFSNLKGMGSIQRFNIHKAFDTSKLPTSHTCMNQLDLPDYESKEELKEKLTKAIIYGKEGFGFA